MANETPYDPTTSSQPCGCDSGAGWMCAIHRQALREEYAAAVALMAEAQQTARKQQALQKSLIEDGRSLLPLAPGGGAALPVAPVAVAPKEHAFEKNLIEDSKEREDIRRLSRLVASDPTALPYLAAPYAVERENGTLAVTPKGEKPTNPKNPIGSDKVPMHLWPETATALGALALLDGGLKYGIANYRVAGVRASIYIAALKRHIAAWYDAGEDCASDSQVEHLGHALACLAIIIDAKELGVLIDDRPRSSAFMRMSARLEKTVAYLRERHKGKNPRHYTIADNGIGTFPDPKERAQS